ncbi:hypothetical protein J3Q64DRAFT_1833204 [Phycomyces blakesleeanus]|uniref:Uncharacterized protein n=1 Tax=Phycomyces blakesleeanus TaxID=4837 RepID=A0ABR3B4F5_PHYBL
MTTLHIKQGWASTSIGSFGHQRRKSEPTVAPTSELPSLSSSTTSLTLSNPISSCASIQTSRKIPCMASYEKYMPRPMYAPHESIYRLNVALPQAPIKLCVPRRISENVPEVPTGDLFDSLLAAHQLLEGLEGKEQQKPRIGTMTSQSMPAISVCLRPETTASQEERRNIYDTAYWALVKADSGLGNWLHQQTQKEPMDLSAYARPQSQRSRLPWAPLFQKTKRCFVTRPWSTQSISSMAQSIEERPARAVGSDG